MHSQYFAHFKIFVWRRSGWRRRRDLLKLHITALDAEFGCKRLEGRLLSIVRVSVVVKTK